MSIIVGNRSSRLAMPVQRKNVQDFLKNGGGKYFRPVFVRECDLKTDEIRDRKTERISERESSTALVAATCALRERASVTSSPF
jgi:hypothetical protein